MDNEKIYEVVMYLKSNRRHIFPEPEEKLYDLAHAREVASRIVSEYGWIINSDGTEEFYPITEIEKAKIKRREPEA